MLEHALVLPFETEFLGSLVTVESLSMNDDDEIIAVCVRDGKKQSIALVDLPLPEKKPVGAEWVDERQTVANGVDL